MATTATISISSDIAPGFSGIANTMTLTKAGALTDLEETIGFSRRKFAATTATDLIRMADELVDTTATTTSAKVYIQNIGDGKGTIDKAAYVTVSIGVHDGTMQEIGRLYGGDWTLFPVTTVDGQDVVVAPSTNDAVVLEYTMFYE
tara:strand:- start:48 stop:485 length:438 start_codon:yes stop_codon:yes gene_type:complete